MMLGAAWRRFSSRSTRATGLISTTVLLWSVGGSFAIPAAAAPYPPTAPCALSWSETSVRGPMLVGSGYDTKAPVTVTVYPQARRLGSYSTNAAGAFEAPVDVPQGSASWVTASSPHRSCSVTPPPGGGTGSRPPTTPGSPGGTSSTIPVSPGSGVPSTGTPPGGATGGSSPSGSGQGGSGQGGSGQGGSGQGGSGQGGSAAPYPPYPPNGPTTGSTSGPSGGPGGSTTPSTPTSSTGPSGPSSSARTAPNNADSKRASTLGLPLSIIVTIAALLLLAGGLGVLFLTRRAG